MFKKIKVFYEFESFYVIGANKPDKYGKNWSITEKSAPFICPKLGVEVFIVTLRWV